MVDVFSRQKRSYIMSRVKGHGNATTELRLIRIFREQGLTGWRRRAAVFGRPDFVFPKARVAIFVDGCFWHGCPLHGQLPAANRIFWQTKLLRNIARDKAVNRELRRLGWSIVRFWQHELRDSTKVTRRLERKLTPARAPQR
jgi:DNA mismatch endonuclease (patch repair protein)